MSAREYTKGYELTKSRRQQYIELPQAKRTSRDVPCRPCVAAMMRTRGQGSKKRAADTCRGFMVDCTDKSKFCICYRVPSPREKGNLVVGRD